MKKTATAAGFPDDDFNRLLRYLWAVYIDNCDPGFEVDELAWLHRLDRYYGAHPYDENALWLGILLYERAFSEEDSATQRSMFAKAREVLEGYRAATGVTGFDALDDRLADLDEILSEPAR